MQTVVTETKKRAYSGLVSSSAAETEVDSRLASGVVYGGKIVTSYAVTETNPDLQKIKHPTSAAEVARFEGLSIVTHTADRVVGTNHASFPDGSMVGVMRRGKMWCECGNAVTDITKPVYTKITNGNLTQVFYLTLQDVAAADKVYTFKIQAPNGAITTITHTATGTDESTEATAIALLINAITGIGATASGAVITCTADNADETWRVLDLIATDIVLTGETSPTVGVLGSIRSGADVVQVQTITLADTAAASKLYPLVIENTSTGEKFSITHTASGNVEATEATAIAALINAIDGLGAAAVDEVITVTADNLDELWVISGNADMVVVETTSTDWTKVPGAKIVSFDTIDSKFFAEVSLNK